MSSVEDRVHAAMSAAADVNLAARDIVIVLAAAAE